MNIIKIIGNNYLGYFEHIRYASRAVIIKDQTILLSYEKGKDLWMLPGGGMEDDEVASDTAIREVREETGHIIKPSEIVVEVDECYEDYKYVTYYFFGEVVGKTNTSLTEGEKIEGLEPRWITLEEALEIFSKYNEYPKEDWVHRGIYLREYKALLEMLSR